MKSLLSRREDDTQATKESLRREMRSTRRALSFDVRARASRAACEHLLALTEIASASVVAVYSAIRMEIDPAWACHRLRERGVTLVYPRLGPRVGPRVSDHPERGLAFHRVADPRDLVPGPLGVLEPRAEHPLMPLERIDTIVVPGLAFDRRGARLGWGKGYYDITLARSSALRIGFAHRCQLIDQVPTDEHDVLMDLVVTDAGVARISRRAHNRGSSLQPQHDP